MTSQSTLRTITFQPFGEQSMPTATTRCRDVAECARLEWWVGDPGSPATVAAAFLGTFGLGMPRASPPTDPDAPTPVRGDRSVGHRSAEICGAAVFVSAAAGASMIGALTGAPSPAQAVPDLAVVVYAHDHTDRSRRRRTGRHSQDPGVRAGPWAAPGPAGHGWSLGRWQRSWSPRQHATAVAEVRAAIARGDVYQVNVVGHACAPYRGDPTPVLRRVTALPGARHGGVIGGAGWTVASASPELLVRVERGLVETRPIKGTRPATAAGRRDLLASGKERAEHVMIVDLERNDLAQVARMGTVNVPILFAVRRWCDLWQAESRVVARIADGVDLAGLLCALCPGGSVTGAPKLAALREIAALEPVGRGAGMGALGWLDTDRLELGLTIRTVAVDGERVHLWAGGGITWDSDPDAEVAEAEAKAAPLRAALARCA